MGSRDGDSSVVCTSNADLKQEESFTLHFLLPTIKTQFGVAET